MTVEKGADGPPLTLTFAQEGETQKAEFDMVVVLTKPEISSAIKSLSKKLGQEVL